MLLFQIASNYGSRAIEIFLIDFGVTVTVEVTELREIPPPLLKDLIIIPPQVSQMYGIECVFAVSNSSFLK